MGGELCLSLVLRPDMLNLVGLHERGCSPFGSVPRKPVEETPHMRRRQFLATATAALLGALPEARAGRIDPVITMK